MVIIERKENKNKTISFIATGHAGNIEDSESRLVCSAVSILIQTFIQCGQELASKGLLKSFSAVAASGNTSINISCDEKHENNYENLERVIVTGLLLLQNSFPDKVTLVV